MTTNAILGSDDSINDMGHAQGPNTDWLLVSPDPTKPAIVRPAIDHLNLVRV